MIKSKRCAHYYKDFFSNSAQRSTINTNLQCNDDSMVAICGVTKRDPIISTKIREISRIIGIISSIKKIKEFWAQHIATKNGMNANWLQNRMSKITKTPFLLFSIFFFTYFTSSTNRRTRGPSFTVWPIR